MDVKVVSVADRREDDEDEDEFDFTTVQENNVEEVGGMESSMKREDTGDEDIVASLMDEARMSRLEEEGSLPNGVKTRSSSEVDFVKSDEALALVSGRLTTGGEEVEGRVRNFSNVSVASVGGDMKRGSLVGSVISEDDDFAEDDGEDGSVQSAFRIAIRTYGHPQSRPWLATSLLHLVL